jgi:hypothetical protein
VLDNEKKLAYMILLTETKAPLSEERLDQVFAFAESYLSIPESAYVTLRFVSLDGVSGYCEEEDAEEGMVIIEIDKGLISEEDIITTIFHEMVHCRQILDGSLVQGNPSSWKGVEYDGNYHELPWEVEAYAIEGDMVREFYDE